MLVSDLAGVLAIEEATFPTPWKREHFVHELCDNPFACNRVIRTSEGTVVAYANAWILGEELRVNNLAVREESRRQGCGEALMRNLLRWGRVAGCEVAFLETRRTNTYAIKLYEKLGFLSIGLRRGYYRNPCEDALVMRRWFSRGVAGVSSCHGAGTGVSISYRKQ